MRRNVIMRALLAAAALAFAVSVSACPYWFHYTENDGTKEGLKNCKTGPITIEFHDFADTTDDDMSHATIYVNCTDTSSGHEDCDLELRVVEDGAAPEARLAFDADGGATLGSSHTNSVTITTDGTGDGELVLPLSSVAQGEILDVPRSVVLPIGAMAPCAGAVPGVWDASAADTAPDLAALNTALVIEYDPDDTDEVCASFLVPTDYASGGTFIFRCIQGVATGAHLESIEARVSVDGAAIGAADEVSLANTTIAQSVTLTPTGTWTANASIRIAWKQGNPSADDTVNVLGVYGRYTASQ